MEQVFIWTGFICLMIIAIALTFYISVAALQVAFKNFTNSAKILNRMRKWHKSFPKNEYKKRYVATYWDYHSHEFVGTKFVDEIEGKEEQT